MTECTDSARHIKTSNEDSAYFLDALEIYQISEQG